MRPIMMRYRANNIMFNKQTTATSRLLHTELTPHHSVRFDSIPFRRRRSIHSICIWWKSKNSFLLICAFHFSFNQFFMYIGLFLLFDEKTEREKKKEHRNNLHTPYTWWFYVDQPNRTNINFKNMIIIHGYRIQMTRFVFSCLFTCFYVQRCLSICAFFFATKHHFSYEQCLDFAL